MGGLIVQNILLHKINLILSAPNVMLYNIMTDISIMKDLYPHNNIIVYTHAQYLYDNKHKQHSQVKLKLETISFTVKK